VLLNGILRAEISASGEGGSDSAQGEPLQQAFARPERDNARETACP